MSEKESVTSVSKLHVGANILVPSHASGAHFNSDLFILLKKNCLRRTHRALSGWG